MTKSIIPILITSVFTLQVFSQQNEIINIKESPSNTVDKFKYFSIQEFTKVPLSLSELNVPKINFEATGSHTNEMKQFLEKNMEPIKNRPKTLLEKGIIQDQLLKLDFNKSQINRLSSNFYFYRNSQKKTYASLGSYIQLNRALRFEPNNRFSADLGGFLSRQFNYSSGKYSDIWGATAQIRYNLTNRIYYKFQAAYIIPSGENSYFGNPLFPGSSISNALVFKITDRTNAEFGIRYQYYEFKKTWNLESYGRITYDF